MTIKINNNYVLPDFYIVDKLEDVDKDSYRYLLIDKSPPKTLEEVFVHKRLIILGEPGFGKSEILKQLYKNSQERSLNAYYIQLRQYNPTIPFEIFMQSVLAKSPESKEIRLFLDGFDEIRQIYLEDFITNFKIFLSANPDIKYYISSRTNFYKRFPELENLEFLFLALVEFDNSRIRHYLELNGLDSGDIDSVLEMLREPNVSSIVNIPRYLEKFIAYFKSNPGTIPTKFDLYDYFVDSRLNEEDDKNKTDRGPLIKRVLEKLALIMEIYQSNEISYQDFVTFLDDARSNILINLINNLSIEELLSKNILVREGDKILFEERSLQEFLAGCELIRIGNQKTVFDLTVSEELLEINPSWINTTSFYLDKQNDLLDKVIAFSFSNNPDLASIPNSYNEILTRVSFAGLKSEQKVNIFKQIVSNYNNIGIWIDIPVAKRLSSLYEKNLSGFLKEIYEKYKTDDLLSSSVIKGNVIFLIGVLQEKELLSGDEIDYWKDRAIELVNLSSNAVVIRHSLWTLRKFGDASVIPKVTKPKDSTDGLVAEAFLFLCAELDPNNSVDYFFEAYSSSDINKKVAANTGISNLSSPEALKKFLGKAAINQQFQHDLDSFMDRYGKLFESLEKVWDEEITGLTLDLVVVLCKSHYYERRSFEKVTDIIFKHGENALPKLLNRVKTDSDEHLIYDLKEVFIKVLNDQNIDSFIEFLKETSPKEWVIYRLAESIYYRDTTKKEIYDKLKALYPDTFERFEKAIQEHQEEYTSRDELVHKDFTNYLEEKYTDIFDLYNENKDLLSKKITSNDLEKLKVFTVDVLDKIDSSKFNVSNMSFREDGSVERWNESSSIHILADALVTANILAIDLSPYRQKMVDLLNFLHSSESETFKLVLQALGPLSKSEKEQLLNKLENPNYINLRSYLEFIKHYKLSESVNTLKKWLSDEHIRDFEAVEVLEVIISFEADCQFLKGLFNSHKGALKEKANEFLITYCKDEEAINWRIEEIKNRKAKSPEERGSPIFWGEPFEENLGNALISSNLDIPSVKWIDLIDYSYQIELEDKEYHAYSEYLRTLSIKGLDAKRSLDAVESLQRFIKSKNYTGINWLNYHLDNIKRNYLVFKGKPENFTEAIKKYNRIKEAQYLDIRSPLDLKNIVISAIENEIKNWIENAGGYKQLYNKTTGVKVTEWEAKTEPEIQPIFLRELKLHLKNKGINVWREVEADNGPLDFLISYGFHPELHLVLELKLSYHGEFYNKNAEDIEKSTSLHQLVKVYMKGNEISEGLLLIIRVIKQRSIPSEKIWNKLIQESGKVCAKLGNLDLQTIDAIPPLYWEEVQKLKKLVS